MSMEAEHKDIGSCDTAAREAFAMLDRMEVEDEAMPVVVGIAGSDIVPE